MPRQNKVRPTGDFSTQSYARLAVLAGALFIAMPDRAHARDWYVAPGAGGNGTSTLPFGRIQDGIDAAAAGDTIRIAAGTYAESIRTVRSGTANARIVLRAAGPRGSVVVSVPGRVLTVAHQYVVVEGLVLDGQYGRDDTVRLTGAAHYFELRQSEVRRSTLDLIDMGGPRGVVIEGCLIHHALNAANGRTDAHGIAAGPVRDLTIRDTEIHTFSGDGIQVDPGRSAPGWDRVTIERTRIWLAPLPAAENGFSAGAVPGENALDTKASFSLPRATIVISDVTASGFRNGLLANMAAFNLKENVDATVDRVTVSDSEIAFRLRGGGRATAGAWVSVRNAVVHHVLTAFRYEDNIQNLRIWNSTVGLGVTRIFQAASSPGAGLDVRNLLMTTERPREASGSSNLVVRADAFTNAAAHDYTLAPGAVPIDAGETIPSVATDRAGAVRPQGRYYDVGAFEWTAAVSAAP